MIKYFYFLLKAIAVIFIIGVVAVFCQLRNYNILESGECSLAEDKIEIPFRTMHSGHIVVDVKIQGKTYGLIVDSGASNMLFSSKIGGIELGSYLGPGFGIGSSGGMFFLSYYELDQLNLQQIEYKNVVFEVMDDHFPWLCDDNIIGILGKESMRHFAWQFRPNEQKIVIAKDVESHSLPEGTIKLNLFEYKFGHHLYLPIRIDGQYHSKLMVDIGSNGGISLEADSSIFSNRESSVLKIFGEASSGLAGSEEDANSHYFFKDEVVLNTKHIDITGMPIFVSNSTMNTVGLNFLKNYNFTLDWKSKVLYLENLDDKNYYSDKFGIRFRYSEENQEFLIASIVQNSKGDQLGLKFGMKVHEINGEKMDSNEAYCSYLNLVYPDSLNLVVEIDGELKRYLINKKSYSEMLQPTISVL